MSSASEDYQRSLLEWAQVYASWDWPVIPCYGPFKRDVCQCTAGKFCNSKAKHPVARIVPHGLSEATTDDAQISEWWAEWPRANIGIVIPQGFVVLDLDGPEALDAIAAQAWKIPLTVSAATAHGWHYWFRTELEVRPGTRFLDHVDLRGPGSYVIAPPSLHASGVQYSWERSPLDMDIPPAPDWLYAMIEMAKERRHQVHDRGEVPELIGDGSRNDTLTRIAGAMRRYGCSQAAILAALEVTNQERCRPCLEDSELRSIASSVSRYAPLEGPQPADW